MLTKEQQKQIATLLKIDEAKLSEAITATDEVTLELADGIKVFTPAELESRDRSVKSKGYNEGKVAGVEMFVADQKEALGLDFDGKDGAKLIEALQAKTLTDAKMKPDEKVKEHEKTIAGLKENITKLEGQLSEKDGTVKKLSLTTKLATGIPAGVPVDQDEFLYAMEKSGYSFEETEAGIIVKKNGQPLTAGNTEDPVDYKAAMLNYAKEDRKWLSDEPATPVGRGGSSSTPRHATVAKKATEFEKQWQAEGKSLQSADYNAALTAAAKAAGDGFWEE